MNEAALQVHEMMFRLGQIAYEQLRRSGAALLRQMKLEERIKFLERVILLYAVIFIVFGDD